MTTTRKSCIAVLLMASFGAAAFPAHAQLKVPFIGNKKKKQEDVFARKPTPAQNALVDKAIAREKEVVKVVKERAPLVETYIQGMKPDPVMLQVPMYDQHFLGRVDFGRVIGGDTYQTEKSREKNGKLGFFKNSLNYITGLSKSLHLEFNEAGFIQMLLIDSKDFDRQHYNFSFVRNDFLGSVPTAVFNVEPAKENAVGRFFGRIWIETQSGNIVRFNGSFSGSNATITEYYHFDSWRTNVQENIWLPASFYVEESDPKSTESTIKFKAIGNIWGYALRLPQKEAENTTVEVQGATDVSNDSQDVGPLAAQREWVQQAEDNIIERLFQAGLLDAPSEFDKTLEALANNILAYNQIPVSRPIKVRILLTEPLESLAIGNTILLSKSLIDTTAVVTQDGAQQMGNLNALLAFQVAHIVLSHRLDTKYAFNDRLLFPDTSAFTHIPMHHTDKDNEEAAKKAVELLQVKELMDGQQYFGLYLQQLAAVSRALPALNKPMIGDGLIKSEKDQTFWLAALQNKGIKLDPKDLKQKAAEPLASYLKFDSWTDTLQVKHAPLEPILSMRDKMPFEVTPIYIKLQYYKAPVAPTTAGTTPSADGAAAPAAAQPPTANGTVIDNTQPPAGAPVPPQTAPPAAGASNPPQN